jgi:hypothetical protein
MMGELGRRAFDATTGGTVNIDRSTLGVDHYTIDDDGTVLSMLESQFKSIVLR